MDPEDATPRRQELQEFLTGCAFVGWVQDCLAGGVSMRRVMLLGLLALALPTAGFANSISFASSASFNFDTGNFVDFKIAGCIDNGCTATFTVVGSLNTISLTTGPLTVLHDGEQGCIETICLSWSSGGSVTVSHNGSVLFTNSLSSGSGATPGLGIFIVGALLLPNSTVAGGFASLDAAPPPDGFGFANVSGTFVPEPGTLVLLEFGLLGYGGIGLAQIARQQKVKRLLNGFN